MCLFRNRLATTANEEFITHSFVTFVSIRMTIRNSARRNDMRFFSSYSADYDVDSSNLNQL